MTNREDQMASSAALAVVEDRPSLALELPDRTTFGEWLSIGRKLRLGSQALNWHIGDWWKFGVSHWGEDETRKSALEIWGVEGETARVYGWVAAKFEPVTRVTELSFTHYREAAALPEMQAQTLLDRAARDNLSTREVRREVQAIKAANDPDPSPDELQPIGVEKIERPLISQTQAIWALELVIELADTVEQLRGKLTKRESDELTKAKVLVEEVRGRRLTYRIPDTFQVDFVEKGRVACEAIHNVSRVTVNHWLIQCGKRRLIEARASFVRHQRDLGHDVRDSDEATTLPIGEDTMLPVAREAAHFLRVSRYGGWRISPAPEGGWHVGTVHKTSDELIAMAERQGFDSALVLASLQDELPEGVQG